MKNLRQIFADLERWGRLIIAVLLFFYLSQLIWPYIELPYRNIYESHGYVAQVKFNPLVNSLRYVVTLILTIGGPTFVSLLSKKHQKVILRFIFIACLAFSFFLIALVPRVSLRGIDFLHDGERLGNAAELLKGRHLYSEMFLLHGAFEDPIVALISFPLFSHSIGSYYLFLGSLLLASFLLFFIFLALVVRSELVFYLAGLWFFNLISGSNSLTVVNFSVSHLRDIFVWIVLILLWVLVTVADSKKWLLLVIGFLSSFQFFIAVERGYYLTFFSLFLAFVLLFFSSHRLKKTNKVRYIFALNKKVVKKNILKSAVIISGLFLGFLFHLFLVGFESFKEFLRIAFWQIPKMAGYFHEQEFRLISQNSTLKEGLALWLPLFLIIINGLILAHRLVFKQFYSKLTSRNFFILVLYILSLVFFRSALITGGAYHLNYGSTITYLVSFLILDGFFSRLKKSLSRKKYYQGMKFLAGFAFMIWILFTLNLAMNFRIKEIAWRVTYSRCLFYPKDKEYNSFMAYLGGIFFCPPYRHREEIRDFLRISEKPDEYWLDQKAKEAISFINENTTKDDFVFVFSNEGLFYYFLAAKSPTRFISIYLADTKVFREEALRDLKRNQPKYIIYTTGSSSEVLNDIPMKSRFSDINAWILANYPQKIVFDKIVILSK